MRLVPSVSRASDDGAAIARSLKSPEAFTEVFDRHFPAVHRYLARRVGRDTADDLAAQTFTLAFAHRGRYRDDLGTARPWLFGIATNLIRAERRRDQRQLGTVHRLALELTAPIRHEDDRIGSALATLEPGRRDALLLHTLGDLSYAEIAAALEIPIGTVRSRISRACAALRLELEPPVTLTGERRHHA